MMNKIPAPSKKRLVALFKFLEQSPLEKITSVQIAKITGWSCATVRRDISLLQLHCGISNGYFVEELKNKIASSLKLFKSQEKYRCCIVGLEKLGQTLLEGSFFNNCSFELVAAFDTNQNRLDLVKSNIPLFPTLDLELKIRSLKIEYAILCVADEKAQFIADRLVKCGVHAILNYTNVMLTVSNDVKLINAGPSFLLNNLL